jgi:hypothetical protein
MQLLLVALLLQTVFADAPKMSSCQSGGKRDLGLWDDAFSYAGKDSIILRNGPELFSFPPASSGGPTKLATIPEMIGTKIVGGVESSGRQWLFLQSETSGPFAVDLMTRKQAIFPLPGVKIPGRHAPEIQWSVIVKHAGGAIFELSGGDPDSWPRPENRSLYYWFSLESGRTVLLPIGWDLLYFSADQKISVFWNLQGERAARGGPQFAGRPVAAISMATGEVISDVPDQSLVLTVPFEWTDRNDIKPLAVPDTGTFAGISVNGTPYPFDMKLEGRQYLDAAQAERDAAVFSLRHSGTTGPIASTLWWVRLAKNETPRLLAEKPESFEPLGKRFWVFATSDQSESKKSSEAFVYDSDTRRAWNVLDSVQRLPALDPEIAQKNYIQDAMTVRLVRGFGSSRYPALVASLFFHSRFDLRANTPSTERLSQQWHRAVLLSAQGVRCTADIPQTVSAREKLWLHNSGKLLVGQDNGSEGAPEYACLKSLYCRNASAKSDSPAATVTYCFPFTEQVIAQLLICPPSGTFQSSSPVRASGQRSIRRGRR